jgi:CHAD domain-containing protein
VGWPVPAGLGPLEMHLAKNWESSLRTSLKQRWKCYRRALDRCQKKFSEKAVHGSRVETRRLLSLVELLNVFLGESDLKKTRRILKRHLNAFDPLRDVQVQRLLVEQCQRQFPETEILGRKLAKREKHCLKTARQRLDKVRVKQLKEVIKTLLRQLNQLHRNGPQRKRHGHAILASVREAFDRTVTLRNAMHLGGVDTIHQTRIAFKKFRYMVEALQPLFASVNERRLDAMRAFQSRMGEVQDSEIFLTFLNDFRQRHPARANALARFYQWIVQQRTTQIARCLKHADELDRFWPLRARRRPRRIARSRSYPTRAT